MSDACHNSPRSSLILTAALLVVAGCAESSVPPQNADPNTTSGATQQPQSAEQSPAKWTGFLGLPDDEERTIRDESSDSAYGFVPKITTVTQVSYDEYLDNKRNDSIKAEVVHDGWLYFSIEDMLCVPSSNGASGYFPVTKRYKTKQPVDDN